MKESRRASQRIPIRIEAQFISNKASYLALIKNISECGIYMKIPHTERIENFKPGTKVNLKFKLPSGQLLPLKCKEIWSIKKASNGLIKHIGLEIIHPPQKYKTFYQAVKFFQQ